MSRFNNREGSGWIFDRVLRLYLNIARYQPIHAYIIIQYLFICDRL